MTRSPFRRAARRFAALGPEARRFALRAWLGAPLVRASLAVVGLRATMRWVDALPTARAAREARGLVGVSEGERLIRGVFRHHFVGGECLPQSVLQYLLHRRDGLSVRFVVGVCRDVDAGSALAAHAWVEDGRDGEERTAFAPLFMVGGDPPRSPAQPAVVGAT